MILYKYLPWFRSSQAVFRRTASGTSVEKANRAADFVRRVHAWLHYTTDQVPDDSKTKVPAWQKEHKPNLTGTAAAYRPPGHTLEGGKRAPATGDYEPWRPS
jgi:NADH:ubiquinone oxidoreductase subunit